MKSLTKIATSIAILSSLGACANQPAVVVAQADASVATCTEEFDALREYRNPFLRNRHIGEASTQGSLQSCVSQK